MTMPAGKYYVGDLCYVLQEEGRDIWGQLCKVSNFESGEIQLKNGIRVAVYGTEFGDGVYSDQNGNVFTVDSGTLGCVLVEHAEQKAVKRCVAGKICQVVEFAEPFETEIKGSVIQFGCVRIDTKNWVPD